VKVPKTIRIDSDTGCVDGGIETIELHVATTAFETATNVLTIVRDV
jgi:hypothetical protein